MPIYCSKYFGLILPNITFSSICIDNLLTNSRPNKGMNHFHQAQLNKYTEPHKK